MKIFEGSIFDKILKQVSHKPDEDVTEWGLFAKTYSAPNPAIDSSLPTEVLEKAVLGVTTYLFSNAKGDIKKVEVLGSDETQLNEMLDKAAKEGIQYVNYANRKFAVAMVPVEEGDNIPVR